MMLDKFDVKLRPTLPKLKHLDNDCGTSAQMPCRRCCWDELWPVSVQMTGERCLHHTMTMTASLNRYVC